jgi:hypothetical protein
MSGAARLALLLVAVSLAAAPEPGHAQWIANGTPLCVAPNRQRYPEIVPDGEGGSVVVWFDYRSGTNWDIYAQHLLASGAVDPFWPPNGTLLCNAPGTQDYPELVADGVGGAIVTWQDLRSGSSYDVYAQHVLPSGVVDPAWPANGMLVCDAAENQTYPQIVTDGAGGAIITWVDWRNAPQSDIYAQHVRVSGVADPAWPANGLVLCDAANNQYDVEIIPDDAAGAIACWYDYRSGADSDIYAQHVLGSGAVDTAWTINGTLLCGAVGDQINPQLVGDGHGGAIVTWQDDRLGAGFDLYAQQVRASGELDPAWTAANGNADGTLLCDAPDDQVYPQIASDGAGGAIVTWQDYRSHTSFDVYAQRVLASGKVAPIWPANGTLVCDAPESQTYPKLMSSDAGSTIIIWCDSRGGAGSDLYAQHVLISGVADPAWPTGGTPVCSAASDQVYPEFVSDGAGGAIVAWFDYRSGPGSDIYAVRLYGSGGVAAVSPGGTEQFAVSPLHPNPAEAGTTISLDLPTAQRVSVSVYDVTGQLVRTLAAERELPAGSQSLVWDGRSDAGTRVGAGVYFVRVTAGSASVARRVAVVR